MNISRPIVRVHINCHVTCHAPLCLFLKKNLLLSHVMGHRGAIFAP